MATVEDVIMAKGPSVVVAPSTSSVLDAVRLMVADNVSSIIVRDGYEIRGIFTERDLLRRVVAAGADPATCRLAEVMSTPVKCCGLCDDLQDCFDTLTTSHIRHLAVVEDDALVGLIGLRDLLGATLRGTSDMPTAQAVGAADPAVDTSSHLRSD